MIATLYQSVTGNSLANLITAINTQAALGWRLETAFKDGTTYVGIMIRSSEQ